MTLPSPARQIAQDGMTFLSPRRLRLLETELRSVLAAQVPGDICEFGLAWGGSAALLAQQATPDHPYHGFDVFGMIPAPTSEKDDEGSRKRYEVIASGGAKGNGKNQYYGYRDDSFGQVKALLAKYGKPVDNVVCFLHQGLFADTLPHYNSPRVAFAHIDCDWYDPTKECLAAVHRRIQLGGKIIMDDYPKFGGCKAATDEFLAAHPQSYRSEMKVRLVLTRVG